MWPKPLSATFGFDADGELTSISRYNGASSGSAVSSSCLGYDANGNLTSEAHLTGTGSAQVSYANAFDADNRITSEVRTDGVGLTTTPYSYDAQSQVTGAGSVSYSYDANGNRTSGGSTVGTDNQTSTDGTWNYSYDAVGNLVSRTNIGSGVEWSYGYNLNNQVVLANEYGSVGGTLLQSTAYGYDVFGDLLSESVTVSGTTTVTKFVYDVSNASVGINRQANPMLMELNSSGAVTERFVYDPSGNVLARSGTSGSTYGTAWLLTDRLGSVRDVLNAAGTLEASVSYDAFGNPSTSGLWLGDRGFTGFYYSASTSVDFAQNREYLPSLGQWMSQDPTGLDAGPNASEYAGNDGTNAVDPSGLVDKPSFGASLVPVVRFWKGINFTISNKET